MITTNTITVRTGMGSLDAISSQMAMKFGLTQAQVIDLDEIGYTGKYKGVKMTRNEYFEKHVNTDTCAYSMSTVSVNNSEYTEMLTLTKSEYTPNKK